MIFPDFLLMSALFGKMSAVYALQPADLRSHSLILFIPHARPDIVTHILSAKLCPYLEEKMKLHNYQADCLTI